MDKRPLVQPLTIVVGLLAGIGGALVVAWAQPDATGDTDAGVTQLADRLAEIEARLTTIEDTRPALDGFEPPIELPLAERYDAGTGDGPTDGTSPDRGLAPTPAEPPEEADPVEDTDLSKDAAVKLWIERLATDPNNDTVFTSTIKLGELGDMRAVVPLIGALRGHRDFYVRLGAGTALGQLGACDGVPALIDALDDKDELVRTASVEALYAITSHTHIGYSSSDGREDRLEAMESWRTWWNEHEQDVRAKK